MGHTVAARAVVRWAMARVVLVVLLAACGHPADHATDAAVDTAPVTPHVVAARAGITAEQLGVLVNDDDPLSVSIADYYVAARHIPAANVVHLHVPTGGTTITAAVFAPLAAAVTAAFAATDVQALVRSRSVRTRSETPAPMRRRSTARRTRTGPSRRRRRRSPTSGFDRR